MTEEGQQQPAWRRALDWRTPGWCHESGVHWESWSLNGEACITGLDPPFAGGARLASGLTWLVRAFASHCRRTHDATGMFALTCTGRRMPSTLAFTMSGSFDLALRDLRLIRERVRRRGGDPAACCWPAFWLEGAGYDYVIRFLRSERDAGNWSSWPRSDRRSSRPGQRRLPSASTARGREASRGMRCGGYRPR